MALHPKLIDGRCVVHPDLLFLGVVPHPHADVVSAALAPDVVGHLKPDDEDAHVQLSGSFAQRMGAQKLVEPAHLRVIVWRVVLVLAFALSHLEAVLVLKR